MWIHGDLVQGPRTLYPPTAEQFSSLIAFLLAEPDHQPVCPLPIRATISNRPRWDSYHAFAKYHIFRDRYERVMPPQPPKPRCVRSDLDWPELHDEYVLSQRGMLKTDGTPFVTEEQVTAAESGIYKITPSSPLWRAYGNKQSTSPGE
jgi:hypothetical protein